MFNINDVISGAVGSAITFGVLFLSAWCGIKVAKIQRLRERRDADNLKTIREANNAMKADDERLASHEERMSALVTEMNERVAKATRI